MTVDQQLQAALRRIEKVCSMRPELRPLGQINAHLLRKLFGATEPLPSGRDSPRRMALDWQPDSMAGATHLGEMLPLDEAILRNHWLDVCDILSTNESHASAGPLAKAVANGSLRVADQLDAVLSGSPDRCRDKLLSLGLDVALGFTVLRLSSLPLLAPIAQRLEPQLLQRRGDCGDCPVCGNGPLLAELRGLEQLRWLRCGWCATQWQMDRLHCPFCGNRNHRQHRDVFVEGQEDTYRLSVCDSCGESLPTLATLMPLSPPELLVAEMETLHLRIVALERSR